MHTPPGAFSVWLTHNVQPISLCLGALFTLGIYSVLYKENRLYRLCEHIFLGLAAGYGIAQVWNDILQPDWWVPMWDKGEWWLIMALVPGLLFYCVYSKKFNWLARLIIGFFLGIASGQGFQAFANDTWPQIPASFKRVWPGHAVSTGQAVNNAIFMVILLSVMSYFFFAFEQKNPVVKSSARLGRWLMMFTFGAIFGLTMMARFALLIDRIYYLLYEFGTVLGGSPNKPSAAVLILLLGLTGLVLFLARRDNLKENSNSRSEV